MNKPTQYIVVTNHVYLSDDVKNPSDFFDSRKFVDYKDYKKLSDSIPEWISVEKGGFPRKFELVAAVVRINGKLVVVGEYLSRTTHFWNIGNSDYKYSYAEVLYWKYINPPKEDK